MLFPPPGDLPDPGIKPASPALAGGFFTSEQATRKVQDVQSTLDLGLLADPWRPQDARSFREEEQAPEDPQRRRSPTGGRQHGLLLLPPLTTAQATAAMARGRGGNGMGGEFP